MPRAAAVVLILGFVAARALATPEPAAFDPDRIAWQRVNPDGTKFALLEGTRDTPGVAFSYAFFIPAGVWDEAHSHMASARVFVVRGTLRLGYGDMLAKGRTVAYPAGSYLVVPAGARHFDGSDVDTLIIGTAVGPWSTDYVAAAAVPSAGSLARDRRR